MQRFFIVLQLIAFLPQSCLSFWPMGCYQFSKNDGLHLIDVENHPQKPADIDWLKWDDSMPGLICRCAQKAQKYGYNVFGIQYYGECWAGQLTEGVKQRLTPDQNGCVGKKFSPCADQKFCVGKASMIMLYENAVSFSPKGCYNSEDDGGNKVLGQLILTERYRKSPLYGGHIIDWANWNEYLPAFIGRCAQRAKRLGFKHFAIEYYGECYAENLSEDEKQKLKPSPRGCVGKHMASCNQQRFCAGKASQIMLYEFVGQCLSGPGDKSPVFINDSETVPKCDDKCNADCGFPTPFSNCTQAYANAVYVIVSNGFAEGSGTQCI